MENLVGFRFFLFKPTKIFFFYQIKKKTRVEPKKKKKKVEGALFWTQLYLHVTFLTSSLLCFFIFFFLGLFVDPFFFFLILFLSICLLVCVDHFFVFGFCLTGRGTCFPFSSFFGWVFFPSSFFSLSFLV